MRGAPQTEIGATAALERRPKVALRNVTKSFPTPDGGRYLALGGVSFDVLPGTFVSIVGPSGCGKSTLLGLVAGLAAPDAGEVLVDGRPVSGVDRRLGFVFQQDALLPWRTVFDNVALGLRIRGLPADEVRRRVEEWIGRVGLRGFERYYPARLSGGMRQRAAIARALSYDPTILLMDEPFGALDALTRDKMNLELQSIHAQAGATVVFVTHSISEAVFLADRVVLLTPRPGRIRSITPVPLARPRSLETETGAEFQEIVRELRHELDEE